METCREAGREILHYPNGDYSLEETGLELQLPRRDARTSPVIDGLFGRRETDRQGGRGETERWRPQVKFYLLRGRMRSRQTETDTHTVSLLNTEAN